MVRRVTLLRMAIAGVRITGLCAHLDERGSFSEIFRATWVDTDFVQWNCVHSRESVLRGVHAHVRHSDYLVLLQGSALIGMKDLRRDSPTANRTELIELTADNPQGLRIPPGVAHGFYFGEPSLHVYAVSSYWDPDDELGCRWDDPGLGIQWPIASATISGRDAALPPYGVFEAAVNSALPTLVL